MANSQYAYVRQFEAATDPVLLPGCFVVVRVDGQGFGRLSRAYGMRKPNDQRCCDLLVRAAQAVMQRFSPDVALSYGQSDEFSFLFRKGSSCFRRRTNKLTSLVPSVFSAAFVRLWPHFFPEQPLRHEPAFDGRAVLFPGAAVARDYLRWRQVDCHVNNLYNSAFHALTGDFVRHSLTDKGHVQAHLLAAYSDPQFRALTPQQATQRLSGSVSRDKNELLFSQFGVNYNDELQQFRKGSLIVLTEAQVTKNRDQNRDQKRQDEQPPDQYFTSTCETKVLHIDIIKEAFWEEYKYLADYMET